MNWFQRVKNGLSTAGTISNGIKLSSKKKLDSSTLQELEDTLLLTDLGVKVTEEIIKNISKVRLNKDASDEEIRELIKSSLANVLEGKSKELKLTHKPHVILLCGVNGNGKTTTAGKIANKLSKLGKKVMLVACDTFRAAAIDQLKIWAERASAEFISGDYQSDPASIAFKALQQAQANNFDAVIIDTAGRLHNKQNLMDELSKVTRVITKLDPDAPHDCILVIDATTGQNAITQVDTFLKSIGITGLIITKLDGSAKGGILINITKQFGLPIYAIGVGEAVADLNNFNSKEFIDALI